MRHLLTVCYFVSLVLPTGMLRAESAAAVLSRMDQAAPNFNAMSANIQLTNYNAILSDKTVEDGTLVTQRLKKDGSVRAILDFSGVKEKSARRVIAFLGNVVKTYYPNAKLVQTYDFGKNNDVLKQYLLLGFGSSGKELMQSYDITAEGSETIAGQETTKLLLVPKTASVKDRLLKIEMWIPANAAYPVQQRFYQPANNYMIATYTAINLKPVIKGKELNFKVPPGTKSGS